MSSRLHERGCSIGRRDPRDAAPLGRPCTVPLTGQAERRPLREPSLCSRGHTGCSARGMKTRSLCIAVLVLACAGCAERTLKDAATDVALQQRLAVPPGDVDADHALWNA